MINADPDPRGRKKDTEQDTPALEVSLSCVWRKLTEHSILTRGMERGM